MTNSGIVQRLCFLSHLFPYAAASRVGYCCTGLTADLISVRKNLWHVQPNVCRTGSLPDSVSVSLVQCDLKRLTRLRKKKKNKTENLKKGRGKEGWLWNCPPETKYNLTVRCELKEGQKLEHSRFIWEIPDTPGYKFIFRLSFHWPLICVPPTYF